MNRFKNKYKNSIARILLFGYLAFIVINSVHLHHYEISSLEKYSFKDLSSSQKNGDLVYDDLIFCSLHQFANTLLNYQFTSNSVFVPLKNCSTLKLNLQIPSKFHFLYSDLSPRAPPFNS